MNSLLSIIMAVVMAFSVIGGAIPAEGPVSFDAKISMDVESLLAVAGSEAEVSTETEQTVKVIGDILNALTLKGIADKETVELDLLAGNDVMLSMGVKNTEAGSTFASSLLGSYVVFTSAEMQEMLKQEMMNSITESASGADIQAMMGQYQNYDSEQMKKDCKEWAESLTKSFEEKKGETETGEFTVDGMTFTARTPVNMTYKEFMKLVLNKVKELLAKESFQPVLQAYGQETDLTAEIDKALEKLENQTEEEQPELQLAIYNDEAQNEYCVCDMIRTVAATEEQPATEEKVCIGYGKVAGLQRSHAYFIKDKQTMDMTAVAREDGSMDIEAAVVSDSAAAEINANRDPDGHLDMVCDIKSQEGNAIIHVKTEAAEGERTGFLMDMYYGSTEKPLLSITGSAGKGGETVSVFEGEDLTVVPMEKLMDTEDTTTSGRLSMTMLAGLLKSVTILTKNLPEDTANWVNAQVAEMMHPSSKTTEAPQVEPVTGD